MNKLRLVFGSQPGSLWVQVLLTGMVLLLVVSTFLIVRGVKQEIFAAPAAQSETTRPQLLAEDGGDLFLIDGTDGSAVERFSRGFSGAEVPLPLPVPTLLTLATPTPLGRTGLFMLSIGEPVVTLQTNSVISPSLSLWTFPQRRLLKTFCRLLFRLGVLPPGRGMGYFF